MFVYDTIVVTDMPLNEFQVNPGLMKSCSLAYGTIMDFLQQQTKDQRVTEKG